MRVIFLTKYYQEGASSRYRSFNYSNYLNEQKIVHSFNPLFYEGYVNDLYSSKKRFIKILFSFLKRVVFLISTSGRDTFLVIEKELFPNVPAFVERMLLYNKQYSLDYDDAVFIKYENNLLLSKKHVKIGARANFITVGNTWYFSQFPNGRCIYLPTVVDVNKYPEPKEHENIIPIICWIGTPNNIKYLESLLPVFKKMKESGIRFKIRIIGGEIVDPFLDIENILWKEDTEYHYLSSSDIGIMPLFESAWENGKCGFKLIQYMISKLPVVGSPSPANSEIIAEGINGYIANNPDQWDLYLSKLCSDIDLRNKLGANGRKTIIEKYTYQRWAKLYIDLIKKQLPI